MTETTIHPVTKVARNLSAIEDMTAALLTQAVHKANDREMPGGDAMVALASVASPEAWEHIFEAAEAHERDTTYADDQDDTWEPPLQTLLFWSEQWRAEHGYELDRRPTIASEAGFIRWALNWAWENEAKWDDFARDIHRARLRLEDVLYAGRRAERSRVVCPDCDGVRLIKVYGETERFDGWKCPACKKRLDADEFKRAHAKQLRSQGAERYVQWRDALATLRTQGRPERTVRQWVIDGEVDGFCDLSTRVLWVWWPDLWRLHVATPTRQRKVSA